MAERAGAKRKKRGRKRAKSTGRAAWRMWVGGGVALLAIVALAWVLTPEPELELESWLAERALMLNPGFAGHYLPGTVVKTRAMDDDGTVRDLERPVVLLWGERCFPGKTPQSSDFPLPRSFRRRETALRLGGDAARRLLPSFTVEGAKSWQLEFTRPRLEAFALADLARQFSDECLDVLEQTFDAGTDPAWLATILEAVVADELRITVDWQAGVGAEAQTREAAKAAQESGSDQLTLELSGEEEGRDLLVAEGPVVVAYRLARMVPVEE